MGEIIQWDNTGGLNGQFKINSVGDGAFTLQAGHSSKFINVSGSSTDDGAKVHQWTAPATMQHNGPSILSCETCCSFRFWNRISPAKFLLVKIQSCFFLFLFSSSIVLT